MKIKENNKRKIDWKSFFQNLYLQNYEPFRRSGYGSELALLLRKLVVKRAKEKFHRGGKTLDIGCGIGNFADYFQDYFGIDIIKSAIEELKIKHQKNNVLVSDAENLPFKKESFSFIIAVEVLQYIRDKEKFFDEIFRVMKPNSYAVIITQNPNSIIWRIRQKRRGQSPLEFVDIHKTIENIKKRRGVILSFGGLYTPFDPLLFFFLPNYNKKFVEIFAKAFWIVFKKQ
ncbi:MAG: class I SAM-dependent methyltransferase [Candidatus Calescibacterium sp.]|jgi:SAM-dependent methyltransferase